MAKKDKYWNTNNTFSDNSINYEFTGDFFQPWFHNLDSIKKKRRDPIKGEKYKLLLDETPALNGFIIQDKEFSARVKPHSYKPPLEQFFCHERYESLGIDSVSEFKRQYRIKKMDALDLPYNYPTKISRQISFAELRQTISSNLTRIWSK